MRCSFVALTDGDCGPLDPTHYSSWLKLRRIRARVNRFVQDCKKKPAARMIGELIAGELKRAEVQLIKQAQRHQFPEEWKALTSARSVPSSSKLISLNPTLDDVGVIRSDGRLKNAKFLSYDVRNPFILARKGWVTTLIVKDAHEQGKHASGTNHTLATLSSRYWILSGREAIREWETA